MRTFLAGSEEDKELWQQFVQGHASSTNYHRWGWRQVIENSFGWKTHYWMAEDGGKISGVLPLVWQKSWLFGSFLTSLPFLNCGGVVADNKSAKVALVQEAIALAERLDARHLEMRHRYDPQLGLPTRTNKVSVVKPVELHEEKMWASLPHKVRTDVRKATKAGFTATFGSQELLDEFYRVFAVNMRDLGTPVYSRRFFQEILRVFPADTHICILRHQREPVAASLLTGFRDTLEACWSSSLYRYISMKPNMLLYLKILCFAGQRGYRLFDFGRSSVGSGTHRFKMQWGAQEIPLYWVYWVPEGASLPQLNPENPRYRFAIRLWQKLPVQLAKWVGPPIVKRLP